MASDPGYSIMCGNCNDENEKNSVGDLEHVSFISKGSAHIHRGNIISTAYVKREFPLTILYYHSAFKILPSSRVPEKSVQLENKTYTIYESHQLNNVSDTSLICNGMKISPTIDIDIMVSSI